MTHILGRKLASEPGAKHYKENVVALVSIAGSLRLTTLAEGLESTLARRGRSVRVHPGRRSRTEGETPDRVTVRAASAALGPELLALLRTADWLGLVSTAATESLADAYGVLKYAALRNVSVNTGIIVAGARSEREAELVAAPLIRTARAFLGRSVEFLGYVPDDVWTCADSGAQGATGRERTGVSVSACLEEICERLEPTNAPIRRVAAWWMSVAGIFL